MFTRQLQRCHSVYEETSYLKMVLYNVCPHEITCDINLNLYLTDRGLG